MIDEKRELMKLPIGETCNNCIWFECKCKWLIQCNPSNTSCDWSPSRFIELKENQHD